MSDRIIVVGAGIVGAAIAFNLARAGRDVLVVEAGLPGQGASGRSFGWINASYYHDEHHHRMRAAAMSEWRALAGDLGDALRLRGALVWDVGAEEQARQFAELNELGYSVGRVERDGVAGLAPALAAPPEAALFMREEGAVEAELATAWFLKEAAQHGARVLTGLAVDAVMEQGGRVTGVSTETGSLKAGHVVLASGVATDRLAGRAGVAVPMLRRPGLILKTRPVAPVVGPVLVTPFGEVRQDRDGRIVASTVAGHQGDDTEYVEGSPEAHGDVVLGKLRAMLPEIALEMETVSLALRPVPRDGLPTIGAAGPAGLYVATMHSGVTLAPLVGRLVAQELTSGQAGLLAPYRPARFQG